MSTHFEHAIRRINNDSFGDLAGTIDHHLRFLMLAAEKQADFLTEFLDLMRKAKEDDAHFFHAVLEMALIKESKNFQQFATEYLISRNLTAETIEWNKTIQGVVAIAVVVYAKRDGREFVNSLGFTEQFIIENFAVEIVNDIFYASCDYNLLSETFVKGYLKRFDQLPPMEAGRLAVLLKSNKNLVKTYDFKRLVKTMQRDIIVSYPRLMSYFSAEELFNRFTLTGAEWIRLLSRTKTSIKTFPPGFFDMLSKKAMMDCLKGGAGNKKIPQIPSWHKERDK